MFKVGQVIVSSSKVSVRIVANVEIFGRKAEISVQHFNGSNTIAASVTMLNSVGEKEVDQGEENEHELPY